jgi:hypothetical protein
LDISFSNDYGSLGRGIYFAKDPKYSIPDYWYNDSSFIYVFLCKVHCGTYKSVKEQFYKPKLFDKHKGIYYYSVCNSQILVVYANYKAYPFYLIKLKHI